MIVAIGADHAGFELKQQLVERLRERGVEIIDVGATEFVKEDDYPDFAVAVAKSVQSGSAERGILICGSGVGVSIAANKFSGVYAAICHEPYQARQGVEHDNMNVLCLGALIIDIDRAEELAQQFLDARFNDSDAYLRRYHKLRALE